MPSARLLAQIPVEIDYPDAMKDACTYVLSGEYESGYDGANCTILDIGANVGSFALWASLRWPGSTIHCFEPNPGTFAYLKRNTAANPRIHINNAAIYPAAEKKLTFYSRFAGDGEAGLAAYSNETFREGMSRDSYEVDVVSPSALPKSDSRRSTRACASCRCAWRRSGRRRRMGGCAVRGKS